MSQAIKKQYVDIADDFKNRCLGECGGPLTLKAVDKKEEQKSQDKEREVESRDRAVR